ncbi:MAG: phosphopentomutase [Erysipelotrichaceae bacterium]|nr:phosphopentomutase [Erysipelotrichaceae bacterium]
MRKYKRMFVIVMDSLGIGQMTDAEKYNDVGADTFGHIAQAVGGLNCPVMQKLGVGNLHNIKGIDPVVSPEAYYTKMMELSVGKDTMTGHWEIMGLNIQSPFQTFTDTGFPQDLMDELEKRTGHGWLGNKSASGTAILDELGEEHVKTGKMIVYTSADSVLQIACHEETFGLDELYRCCEIARDITMKDEWKVGRIIARPFVGDKAGSFKRTSNRHDYALKPYGKTVLDSLKENGYDVISVGKINDIFDGEGVTEAYKSKSNEDGMNITIGIADKDFTGLCFVNLVDFDALWGHRRNPEGYAKEIELFDRQLGELLEKLTEDDCVILTADHGNDPVHHGTDHTREMVPLIIASKAHHGAGLLRPAETFANLGETVADNFEVKMPEYGTSYLNVLK